MAPGPVSISITSPVRSFISSPSVSVAVVSSATSSTPAGLISFDIWPSQLRFSSPLFVFSDDDSVSRIGSRTV